MKLKQFLTAHKPTPAFLPTVGLLIFVLLSLVGCGGTTPVKGEFDATPVQVVVKVPYLCGDAPPVGAVKLRDINWEVIEVEGLQFDEGSEPFTGELFTLTVNDYQRLGMNTSDWLAASAQMKAQRDFYRDCIKRSQKEIQDERVDTGLVSGPTDE